MRSLKKSVVMLWIMILVGLFLSGCATPGGLWRKALGTENLPANKKEMHPKAMFNKDPQMGYVVVIGTMPLMIEFYTNEQYKKLMNNEDAKPEKEIVYGGARPDTKSFKSRIYGRKYKLSQKGIYWIRTEKFYYRTTTEVVYGIKTKKREIVDKFGPQWTQIIVDDRERDYLDDKYSGRAWGWGIVIESGDFSDEELSPDTNWLENPIDPLQYLENTDPNWEEIENK